MNDQDLLREYARNGSEAAFAALVQRHIDLVYSAAQRMVIDPHLAEDVSQEVFLTVAKSAEKLQHCVVLAGWLHRTTRNLAGTTVRTEIRRRARENKAAIMNQDCSATDETWDRLAPHLDDALEKLAPVDRDTLLLRYFERKTASEIGERLGLSEAAAQKRVVRALDQLRGLLCERGVTVTVSALVGAVSLQAVRAAPVTLAASVTSHSLGAVVSASGSSFLNLMLSTNVKLGLAVLTAGCLATTVLVQHQTNVELRAELASRSAQAMQQESSAVAATNSAADADDPAELRQEHAELLRLRGEIATLRQQERERVTLASRKQAPSSNLVSSSLNKDFVPSSEWNDVGSDTPQQAFQSFLTTLKTRDPVRIESAIYWDMKWKEDITDEDRSLMEKSKQDYLEMLQRAADRLSAFNLAPIPQGAADKTRLFFHVLTTDGEDIASSFEMIQTQGQWKPLLSMGWRYPKESSSFFTSAMFGPSIDLGRGSGTVVLESSGSR